MYVAASTGAGVRAVVTRACPLWLEMAVPVLSFMSLSLSLSLYESVFICINYPSRAYDDDV